MRLQRTSLPMADCASSVDPPMWGVRIVFGHPCSGVLNASVFAAGCASYNNSMLGGYVTPPTPQPLDVYCSTEEAASRTLGHKVAYLAWVNINRRPSQVPRMQRFGKCVDIHHIPARQVQQITSWFHLTRHKDTDERTQMNGHGKRGLAILSPTQKTGCSVHLWRKGWKRSSVPT